MWVGSTISAAWARSKEVASTAPGQSRSISPRISSSPGASGKGGLPGFAQRSLARFFVGPSRLWAWFAARPTPSPLLGAVGVVALAPALIGVADDLSLQLGEAVEDRLRPRRAAGDVDVDRQELVGALEDGVVGEHPTRGGAGAHRHHPLQLQHLVVEAADDRRHFHRDPARENHQVGLSRRGASRLGAEAGDVVPRRDGRHRYPLDCAAGEAEGERKDRVRPRHVERFLEGGGEDPFFDVALEVLALEVAAEQVAGAQLLLAQGAALYLQSSAPFRQT